jgi:hypothetical protein
MNAHADGLSAQSWRDLYHTAVHEPDLNKLPERITDAENALVLRARELFYTSDDTFGEEESLDEAMYILHALRSSLKHRPSVAQGTSLDCQKVRDRPYKTLSTAA